MYIAPVIEKKHDISFKINTQLGYGHLRRNVFNVNCNFPASNFGQQVFNLLPGASITMEKSDVLQILTEGELTFTSVDINDVAWTVAVRKILLTDSYLKQWTLRNDGESTIQVKILWVADEGVAPPSP